MVLARCIFPHNDWAEKKERLHSQDTVKSIEFLLQQYCTVPVPKKDTKR